MVAVCPSLHCAFSRAVCTKRGPAWLELIMYVGKAFLRDDFPLPTTQLINPQACSPKAPTGMC